MGTSTQHLIILLFHRYRKAPATLTSNKNLLLLNHKLCLFQHGKLQDYSKADGYIYKPPKTKKSRRTIDISKELAKELKHWQNEQNKMKLRLGDNYIKQDLIFDLGDGNYLNPDTVSSWFPDHAEKIGLPRHNFHILRHTHASILLSLGEDIKKVSERLGHSSVRITYDIYAHLMPGHGKDLAARLEAALS